MVARNLLTCFCLIFSVGCSSIPKSTSHLNFINKYHDFEYSSFEVVKQKKQYSCGAACLSAVLKTWGYDISEEIILKNHPPSNKNGYSLIELKQIAISQGLNAFALSMAYDDDPIGQLYKQISKGRPVIISIKNPRLEYLANKIPFLGKLQSNLATWIFGKKNHYVVAVGISDEEILLMDPAYGFTSLEVEELFRRWAGQKFTALVCLTRVEDDDGNVRIHGKVENQSN